MKKYLFYATIHVVFLSLMLYDEVMYPIVSLNVHLYRFIRGALAMNNWSSVAA